MSWHNQYVQVDKSLADSIREMKAKQEAIPHYKAKVVDLGDLKNQSKCEIMLKLKQNVDEIEKQYENEDSKGWIGSCGYTRFSYQEKYVFPALDYLFDLKGLSSKINSYIEEQCNKYWEQKYGNVDKVESGSYNGNPYYITKRDKPIHHYVRFITDARQMLIWTISEANDIRDIEMLVSFNITDIDYFKSTGINVVDKVNFYLSSGKKIRIKSCESSSAGGEYFDDKESADKYWKEKKLADELVKLSEWKKNYNEMVNFSDVEKYKFKYDNSKSVSLEEVFGINEKE